MVNIQFVSDAYGALSILFKEIYRNTEALRQYYTMNIMA